MKLVMKQTFSSCSHNETRWAADEIAVVLWIQKGHPSYNFVLISIVTPLITSKNFRDYFVC